MNIFCFLSDCTEKVSPENLNVSQNQNYFDSQNSAPKRMKYLSSEPESGSTNDGYKTRYDFPPNTNNQGMQNLTFTSS